MAMKLGLELILLLASLQLCGCSRISKVDEFNTQHFNQLIDGYNRLYKIRDSGKYNMTEQLSKLIAANMELYKMLDKALDTSLDFYVDKDLSTTNETIQILEVYISGRRDFCNDIATLNRNLSARNLTQLCQHHCSSFLDEKRCKDELNYIKTAFFRFRKILEVYNKYLGLCTLNSEFTWLVRNRTTEATETLNIGKKLIGELKMFVQDVSEAERSAKGNDLTDHFEMYWIKELLNAQRWESNVEDLQNELHAIHLTKAIGNFNEHFQPVINICFWIIVLLVGLVGNGFILFIFHRHPETRKAFHSMTLSLAVANMLALSTHMIFEFVPMTLDIFGDKSPACHLFIFCRQLCVSVNVLSLVILSVQRQNSIVKFLHPKRDKGFTTWRSLCTLYKVWLLGSLIAFVRAIFSYAFRDTCLYHFSLNTDIHIQVKNAAYFLLCCVIPGILIIYFSKVSIRQLRASCTNMPNEGNYLDRLVKSRLRISKLLLALPILFLAFYLPIYTYRFIYAWQLRSERPVLGVFYYLSFKLEILCYCLNPVDLYIVSRSFKMYLKKYLCVRCVRNWTKRTQAKIVKKTRDLQASRESHMQNACTDN